MNQPLKHTPTDKAWKRWDIQPEYSLDLNKQYGTLTVAEYNRLKSIEDSHDELVEALKKAIDIILNMPDASFIPAPSKAKQSDIITSHKMANDLLSALKSAGEEV